MNENVTPTLCSVDTTLLNDPARLRERANAIEANEAGRPVDKYDYIDKVWIELVEISAFFYDRRYRARPSAIPPYQQRVIDEKTELDSRLEKLSSFIGTSPNWAVVPPNEQERMKKQCAIMHSYSMILGDRIAAFSA